MDYHQRVPNSPDELIRTWATLPTGEVSVLIPTDVYRRLVGVVEQAVPGGMCSVEHAWPGQSLSVEELVEIALLHYLDHEVLWDNG